MDSHTPRTSHTGRLHGMPLAWLLGLNDDPLYGLAAGVVAPENVAQLSAMGVTVKAAPTTRMSFLLFDAAGRSGAGRPQPGIANPLVAAHRRGQSGSEHVTSDHRGAMGDESDQCPAWLSQCARPAVVLVLCLLHPPPSLA
jgi:hypothetical protein